MPRSEFDPPRYLPEETALDDQRLPLTFLGAAYVVLAMERRPMTAQQIVASAIRQRLLETQGQTPAQTLKAKLSTDILVKKDRSLFMRTGRAIFGLREWKVERQEFVADRFQKALLDEEIMVFDKSLLAAFIRGPGLEAPRSSHSLELIANCRPMQRRQAEEDMTVVQLISAFVIRHNRQILTYKRTKRLPEARLHGWYSLLFGGHIIADEIPPLVNAFDPVEGGPFLARELEEEVKLPQFNYGQLTYRGLLYDDSVALSSQHLGIVYDVQLLSQEYEIGERGFLMDSKFESLDEIEQRIGDFENWSVLIARTERALV